jgi:hypothetical protein
LQVRSEPPHIARVLGSNHPWWLRWSVGVSWLGAWAVLLWTVHRPWGGLGGIVSERLRWLERFVLASGLVVGSTLGEIVRSTAVRGGTHGRGLRWLLYPAGIGAATLMVALRLAGRNDPIGIVLGGLLSYSAGALSACLAIGSYCRGECDSDQRSDEPEPGSAVGEASSVAYRSMASPTKSGISPTKKTPPG